MTKLDHVAFAIILSIALAFSPSAPRAQDQSPNEGPPARIESQPLPPPAETAQEPLPDPADDGPADGEEPSSAGVGTSADPGQPSSDDGLRRAEESAPSEPAGAATGQATGPEPAPATPAEPAAQADAAPVNPVTALTIATWSGAYAQAQERSIFRPYARQQGITVETVFHDGTLEALEGQQKRGASQWDVVDLSGGMAERACDEGLIEKLSADRILAADTGGNALEDFIPGAIKPCAIGSVAWSAVILFNKSGMKKRSPSTTADFFNLKAFPGKRSLPQGPRYNMELALLADGVAPADIYTTLATPEGQIRALNKLNQIKSAIIWAAKPAETVKSAATGDALFALGFNGRAFQAVAVDRAPLGFIWDGQIYDLDYWAIPKNPRNIGASEDFIRFATMPDRLAAASQWFPYGPVRVSALGKVGKHPEAGIDMAPFLPTRPDNFKRALAFDSIWWDANFATVKERFDQWLNGGDYKAIAAPEAPAGETGQTDAPKTPDQ